MENESSSLVEYYTFHDTERDIYPTISICIYGIGIYDSNKLLKKYGIKHPLEYMAFLEGESWANKMVNVKYDDVTLDIEDRVESVTVIGMDSSAPVSYSWARNKEGTNETVMTSEFPSNSTHRFPLYTSYRHTVTKCFSLDLSVTTMPDIQGQLINTVSIAFRNIRMTDVPIQYIISYPGQIIRGFLLDTEIAWNHMITTGYVKAKLFLLGIIEVFRKRNTSHKPCNENWKEDDDTIMLDLIKMANCTPPHWNISMEYPICNTKEKRKKVRIRSSSGFTHASASFLKGFTEPCEGIEAATLNTLVLHPNEQNVSSLIPSIGEDSAVVGFHFKNVRYKEMKYDRAFDFESMIGSVGGYMGMFLGFAIWQLPDAIEFLSSKVRALLGGKIYHAN